MGGVKHGRVFAWVALVLLVVTVACGDDDGGGGSGDGGGHGGDTLVAGESAGGGANAGAPSAGSGLGGPEAGGEGGDGDQVGGAGAGSLAGQAGAPGSSGAAGEGPDAGVTWLDDCDGIDLSADGTTVLATRGIWRAATGWVALPDLAGGGTLVVPRALSRDGAVVFGNSGSALGMEMTRWEEGVPTGLGTLNAPYATNGDGSVAVGLTPIEPASSEGLNDVFDVFVWTDDAGTDTLEQFWEAVGDSHVTNPVGMSLFMEEEEVAGVIGLQLDGSATSFRWTTASVTELSSERRIDALSPDGAVGAFRNAYLLTSPTGIYNVSDFTLLETPECVIEPDPEDGFVKCHHVYQVLTGFDHTGQQGVGYEEGPGIPPIAFFHWQHGEDAQNLVTFLAEHGVTLTLPSAYTIKLARMSNDGSTVLGVLRTTGSAGMDRCFLANY